MIFVGARTRLKVRAVELYCHGRLPMFVVTALFAVFRLRGL
jgi:hypothetical protein